MSDNVPITAGSGTNIASEDVGGVHYQKMWDTLRDYQAPQLVSGTITLGVADGTAEKDGPTLTMPSVEYGLGDRVGAFVRNPTNQEIELRLRHTVLDPVGLKSVTGTASTNLLTSTAHGYAAGDKVAWIALNGGAGMTVGTLYYVIASGLTANDFKISATLGGSELDFTTDVTTSSIWRQYHAVQATVSGAAFATIPKTTSEADGVIVWFDCGLLPNNAKFTIKAVAAMDATYTIPVAAWIRN